MTAESANAQEARVYTEAMGTIHGADVSSAATVFFPAYGANGGADETTFIDGAGTLSVCSDTSFTTARRDLGLTNGLPVFGNDADPLEAGNIVRFGDLNTGAAITIRVYEGAAGFAFAAECLEAVTLKTAGELAADEFFLTDAWVRTSIAAEGQGFVPAPLTEMDCMNLDPPQMLMGEICVEIPPQVSMSVNTGMPATMTATEASAKKDGVSFGGVVGIGAVAVLAILISRGGEEGEFGFSPAFGYSATESGYSAKVGGRMDFVKDEWTLFYTGGQTNANGEFGDFRYSSGGEYKTDFWQAAFSESVQGKTADYDLSLSADLQGGMWSLSPVYRIHSRLEEGETETRNSLNLEGVLEWNRWTIRPSAGFQWRRAEEFADNTRFRLEAVRNF